MVAIIFKMSVLLERTTISSLPAVHIRMSILRKCSGSFAVDDYHSADMRNISDQRFRHGIVK